jgi:hypothetical protein
VLGSFRAKRSAAEESLFVSRRKRRFAFSSSRPERIRNRSVFVARCPPRAKQFATRSVFVLPCHSGAAHSRLDQSRKRSRRIPLTLLHSPGWIPQPRFHLHFRGSQLQLRQKASARSASRSRCRSRESPNGAPFTKSPFLTPSPLFRETCYA